MSLLRREVYKSGYLKHQNPLLKVLVSKLDPEEDIFTLIEEARVSQNLKIAVSNELTHCSSKAELTYIILRLIGIKNLVPIFTYDHAVVAIPLANNRYLFVDFTNDLYMTVELSESESDSSRYYKKGGNWFLKEKYKMPPEDLYELRQRFNQQGLSLLSRLNEQEKLNLLYPVVYMPRVNLDKAITVPVRLKKNLTYTELGSPLNNPDKERAGFFIKKALEECEKAREIDPDNPVTHEGLGVAYLCLGRFPEALGSLNKAIELDDQKAMAFCNRGIAYVNLEKWQEAIADQVEAIKLDPYLEQAYGNLADIYCKMAVKFNNPAYYRQAIEIYKIGLRLLPDVMLFHYSLAVTHYQLQEYPEAVKEFTEAQRLNPESWVIRFKLGAAYYGNEQYKEAIKELKKTSELNPKSWEVHYLLGQAYYKLGKVEEAIGSWREAYALLKTEEEREKMLSMLSPELKARVIAKSSKPIISQKSSILPILVGSQLVITAL